MALKFHSGLAYNCRGMIVCPSCGKTAHWKRRHYVKNCCHCGGNIHWTPAQQQEPGLMRKMEAVSYRKKDEMDRPTPPAGFEIVQGPISWKAALEFYRGQHAMCLCPDGNWRKFNAETSWAGVCVPLYPHSDEVQTYILRKVEVAPATSPANGKPTPPNGYEIIGGPLPWREALVFHRNKEAMCLCRDGIYRHFSLHEPLGSHYAGSHHPDGEHSPTYVIRRITAEPISQETEAPAVTRTQHAEQNKEKEDTVIFTVFVTRKSQPELTVVDGKVVATAVKPEVLVKTIGPITANSPQRALIATGVAIAGEKAIVENIDLHDFQLQQQTGITAV